MRKTKAVMTRPSNRQESWEVYDRSLPSLETQVDKAGMGEAEEMSRIITEVIISTSKEMEKRK